MTVKNFDKEFINFMEAAKILGIHRATLHAWIKKDQDIKRNNSSEGCSTLNFKCPPYGRIGNRYRFRREDLEKFINDSMNDS